MAVTVNKDTLKSFISKVLFEAYPIHSSPIEGSLDTPEAVKDDTETTVPEEIPIEPTEMMASQLADQRPPVEDEDFTPANTEELGRAAKVLVDLVPDDQVEDFYKDLQALIDDKISKQAEDSTPVPDLEGDEIEDDIIPKKEKALEGLKRKVGDIVAESWGDFKLGKRYEDTPAEYYDDYEEPPEPGRDGETLANLQQLAGRATPSGVDKEIRRLLSQVQYIMSDLSDSDLNSLQAYATAQFINMMRDYAELTPDEVDEMRLDRAVVRELDSYRFFFNAAIIMPALKALQKDAYKKASEMIAAEDIPKEVKSMVMYQALGETAEDLDKIKRKLVRTYSPEEARAAWPNVRQAFNNIKSEVQLPGGFLDFAKEKWESTGDRKKSQLFVQALESTAGWQEELQGQV